MKITLCCHCDDYDAMMDHIQRHLNNDTFKITRIENRGRMLGAYDQNIQLDIKFKLRRTSAVMDVTSFCMALKDIGSGPCRFAFIDI